MTPPDAIQDHFKRAQQLCNMSEPDKAVNILERIEEDIFEILNQNEIGSEGRELTQEVIVVLKARSLLPQVQMMHSQLDLVRLQIESDPSKARQTLRSVLNRDILGKITVEQDRVIEELQTTHQFTGKFKEIEHQFVGEDGRKTLDEYRIEVQKLEHEILHIQTLFPSARKPSPLDRARKLLDAAGKGLDDNEEIRSNVQETTLITVEQTSNIAGGMKTKNFRFSLGAGIAAAAVNVFTFIPSTFIAIRSFVRGVRQMRELKQMNLILEKKSKEQSGRLDAMKERRIEIEGDPSLKEEYDKLGLEAKKIIYTLARMDRQIAAHKTEIIEIQSDIGLELGDLSEALFSVINATFTVLAILGESGWEISSAVIDGFTAVASVLAPVLSAVLVGVGIVRITRSYLAYREVKEGFAELKAKNQRLDQIKKTLESQERPPSPMLRQFLLLEEAHLKIERLHLIERRRSALLGIASSTMLCISGVLAFTAVFTQGVTLGVLAAVGFGIGVASIGVTIYYMIKKRELQKEIKAEQETLNPNEALEELVEEFSAGPQRAVELEFLAKHLGVDQELLTHDPTFFFADYFSDLGTVL